MVFLFFKNENKLFYSSLLVIYWLFSGFVQGTGNQHKILMIRKNKVRYCLFCCSTHIVLARHIWLSPSSSPGQNNNKKLEQVFDMQNFGKLTDKCSGAWTIMKRWKYWITHVELNDKTKIWMKYSICVA